MNFAGSSAAAGPGRPQAGLRPRLVLTRGRRMPKNRHPLAGAGMAGLWGRPSVPSFAGRGKPWDKVQVL